MDVPQNETPESVTTFFQSLLNYITAYGWHILFFLVIFNILWSHLKPKWDKWRERAQERRQSAEHHKNPDYIAAQQEALLRSRQRFQEEHDRLAKEYVEKQKQLEEQKRQEKIKQWECMQSGRSSSSDGPSTASEQQPRSRNNDRLRGSDYNPLTGTGSGTTYRPSRRGGASSGG